MSQQINFYNPKLIKSKDWFSLSAVGVVYALSAGAMLFWYQQLNAEATIREQARQVAQLEFEQVQKQMTDAITAKQNIINQQDLDAQLKAMQEKYSSQEQVILAFKQVQGGGRVHIADYMAGLARQRLENVWLTGFKIDAFTDSLTIKGRVLKGELVPQYLNTLSQDPIFQGKLFGGLKLKEFEQMNEHPTQTAGTTTTQTASTTATQKVATPVIEKSISLIEFEVTGMDKPKDTTEANVKVIGSEGNASALEKKKEPVNG